MRLITILLLSFTFVSCTDKSSETKTEKEEVTKDAWELGEDTPIRKTISKEEFQKFHEANANELGAKCSEAAMTYCGKETKDLELTESELICLWQRVYRVTREVLPKLDDTPCAELIKTSQGNSK